MPGPPSEYKPEYADIARKLCENFGATDQQVADFLGIVPSVFYKYRLQYPEFAEALRLGKEGPDAAVVKALYHRAVGYTFEAQEIHVVAGKIERVSVMKHVPPDTTAGIYWTKNRMPDQWRDRRPVDDNASADNILVIEHSPDAD